ncbi:MAG: hypothetical protein EAZ89_05945 [Bacteroidetes bacterium]|nr:MAG: hypothetical protein EAZ89_05945 [Bacteroidota bacterium]
MKNVFLKVLLFWVSCIMAFPVFAQRSHSFSAGTGTIYYYGDLTDRFNNSLLRPALCLSYSKYLLPTVSFRTSFSYGEVGATDAMAVDDARQVRNLHFRSPIYEVSGMLVYEFVNDKNFGNSWIGVPHFSPLVFAGVGMFHFNPQARYDGEWYDLQPLGTEGQYIPGNTPGPYSLWQIAVPFGGGISLRMSEYMGMNLELGYRVTLTDYLDDISTVYPDYAALGEVSGPVAVALSERSADGRFQPGEIRGHSNANDGYFFTTISVTYYLSRFATRN